MHPCKFKEESETTGKTQMERLRRLINSSGASWVTADAPEYRLTVVSPSVPDAELSPLLNATTMLFD